MVLKWLNRIELFTLSTKFGDDLINTTKLDNNGIPIKKPTCVVNYNQCMGSIDKTDMLLSSVECVRKTCKWYKKIFFHLINLSLLNSYSIYKTVTGENLPLANFQLEVIRQMVEKYSSKVKSPNKSRTQAVDQPFRLTAQHFP